MMDRPATGVVGTTIQWKYYYPTYYLLSYPKQSQAKPSNHEEAPLTVMLLSQMCNIVGARRPEQALHKCSKKLRKSITPHCGKAKLINEAMVIN